MTQRVKGFLASDGKFFESEAECLRHEYVTTLMRLCESHNVNPSNFFMLLQEWHMHIKGYYDADSKCEVKQVIATGNISFGDDIPFDTVPSPDDDHEDAPIGDKDAPAFLQQPFRRHK